MTNTNETETGTRTEDGEIKEKLDFHRLYSDLLVARAEEHGYACKLAETSDDLKSAGDVLKAHQDRFEIARKMAWRTGYSLSDFQNRRAIERDCEENHVSDTLWKKLGETDSLACIINESGLEGSHPNFRYVFHSKQKWRYIGVAANAYRAKLMNRTITEEEYFSLLEATPRRMRKALEMKGRMIFEERRQWNKNNSQ